MAHKDIRFLHIFPLRGPSQWTYRPVLEAWVDIGDLEDCPSDTIPGFVDRLCAWLPGLEEHRCSYEVPGGFVRRLHEGTWPPHILEHITLELQNLAGMPGGYGRARETSERGIYKVVISAPHEDFARVCLDLGRELVMAAIEDRAFDVGGAVTRLREMAEPLLLDPSGRCVVAAAEAKDRLIPVNRMLTSGLVLLGYGAKQRRIWGARTDATSAIADGIAGDSDLYRTLLQQCGLPILARVEVASAEEAWAEAQDLGLPAVVKSPAARLGEPGIAVATQAEMTEAFHAIPGGVAVLERQAPGPCYRLLVMNGKLAQATALDPGGAGGAEPVEMPATVVEAACLAARVVGLDLAGVDVALRDTGGDFTAETGAIIGVHASPPLAVAGSADPSPVGRAIVNSLFPDGGDGRIPVVGITGSSGATEVARWVAEFSRLGGRQTGLACGDGLFLNRRQVETTDCANWTSGRRVLLNRWVEAAVLENGADMILGEGLPYDRCQVGVVTNIVPESHYGRFYIDDPEKVFRVLRTQVDVVLRGGTAVLDAGDATAVEMGKLCDGEVIFFAADPAVPAMAAHLERGKRGVLTRDGDLVLATGSVETVVAPLAGIPFLARQDNHGLTSVLASVGAAWALGIAPEVIRTGVETFMEDAPDLRVLVPAKP